MRPVVGSIPTGTTIPKGVEMFFVVILALVLGIIIGIVVGRMIATSSIKSQDLYLATSPDIKPLALCTSMNGAVNMANEEAPGEIRVYRTRVGTMMSSCEAILNGEQSGRTNSRRTKRS